MEIEFTWYGYTCDMLISAYNSGDWLVSWALLMVPELLCISCGGWVDPRVCLSAPVIFNRPFVCVGVDSAVVELSITQCCWLLELISLLCLCLAFRAADALITQQVVSCVLCTYWSFVPTLFFFSFVTVHNVHTFISSAASSLSSGRVWLWFRNQSPASWFHVVSYICSQCLICHIHILLQGKLKDQMNIRKINVMSNPLMFILFQSVLHIWTLRKKWLL